MDIQALENLLERYSKAVGTTRKNELYKWRAVACFQKNWNLEADDFSEMLKASLADSNLLLTNGMYYPRGMIEIFAWHQPDETKQALVALLDESVDLRERLVAFDKAAKALLEKDNQRRLAEGEPEAKNSFQDPRAMNVYLTFAHPDIYFLYKSSMFTRVAELLGIKAPSNKFDKAIAYNAMCNEILAYLKEKKQDFIEASDALVPIELREADPEHHLLVQDIVYFADAYDDAFAWIPTKAQYDPGIEADEWLQLLDNREIFTSNALLLVRRLMECGGQATCAELADRFGNSPQFYINNGSTLGERLVNKAGVPKPNIEGWKTKCWMVPFIGKEKPEKGKGVFIWRLRQELQEALQGYEFPNDISEDGASMNKPQGASYPKNLILYGPPGTGKTYMTKAYAVAICEGRTVESVLDEMATDEGYADVAERYRQLKEKDRIGFVTFHQSYSYEEFVEGLRPDFDQETPYDISSVKNT